MDMLRHSKLKMEIKIKTINWCLSVSMMRSYQENIKLFGIRIKIWKILNKMLYQSMMIDT